MLWSPPVVHAGTKCNECKKMPIRGIRYKSLLRENVDLCETCESRQVHHNQIFAKLKFRTNALDLLTRSDMVRRKDSISISMG